MHKYKYEDFLLVTNGIHMIENPHHKFPFAFDHQFLSYVKLTILRGYIWNKVENIFPDISQNLNIGSNQHIYRFPDDYCDF